MILERARPGDASALLRIFKATSDAELFPFIPFGAAGAEAFLEDSFACTLPNVDTIWLVARDFQVRAFVGLRLSPSGIFINYIHVDPSVHHQKIGSRLLLHSLKTLASGTNSRVGLDVDQKNSRARAWYERLGFTVEHTAHWQLFPLPAQPTPPQFFISGIPQAERAHRAYGFSTITIETAFGSFPVGRMGARYFRTTDPQILDHRSILHAIDPNRELLLISNQTPSGGREISRRDRMSAPVQTVIKNLE
jgi:ribosomal protein S18 acetylase RimI-like enzyme